MRVFLELFNEPIRELVLFSKREVCFILSVYLDFRLIFLNLTSSYKCTS